jgi:stage II sporulation protein Q
MDEKKNSNPSQTSKQNDKAAPANTTGTKNHANLTGSKSTVRTRRVMSKRWIYPAIYLGAAALIIGLMYAKTEMGGSQPTADTGNNVASTSAAVSVSYRWPVMGAASNYKVPMGFFLEKGSAKQQANALVFYDNGYYPHQGMDVQSATKKPFQVTAAASGIVTKVEDNKLYGKTVDVKSADGNVEKYESLGSITVKQGDHIEQGQTIGTSGTNRFEASVGNHLYFEVDKSGTPINPTSLLPKQ